MTSVDLNADLGERSAGEPADSDRALIQLITSVSIACGAHAGDETVMRETVELALAGSVVIGAHPSYPDRANFGRAETGVSATGIFDLITMQVRTLDRICTEAGAQLRYVKPHGALYNRAARDAEAAEAIAAAVISLSPALVILTQGGSELDRAATRAGLEAVSEAFPDRAYAPDGSLAPRTDSGALIEDPEIVARRALQMVQSSSVVATDGSSIGVRVNSLCIHGDGSRAVEAAHAVKTALEARGIELRAFAE